MVKHVTSLLRYAKEVELKNGRVELVEVSIKQMRMKDIVEREWRTCLEIDLELVNTDGVDHQDHEQMSAEELVERWELLRDSWLQLAEGLYPEDVKCCGACRAAERQLAPTSK